MGQPLWAGVDAQRGLREILAGRQSDVIVDFNKSCSQTDMTVGEFTTCPIRMHLYRGGRVLIFVCFKRLWATRRSR